MSMPLAAGGEGFPFQPESEKLLEAVREGVLNRAFERFDEASVQEALSGRVYLQEAPIDTPLEEVMALMLTKDGIRPFRDEKDTKEQLILYLSADFPESITIEHIRDGIKSMLHLDKYDVQPVVEFEDMLSTDAHVDPTPEDFVFVHTVEAPRSEVARLSDLREKIDRFLITPQN